MRTRPLPEAAQRRVVVAVRAFLVIVGAVSVSIAVVGLLDLVVMAALTKFFLLALGIGMVLTGVLRVNLMEFMV